MCNAFYTGTSCEQKGVTGQVNFKYMKDYISTIVIVSIALFLIGIVGGFITYTCFYKTDYKVRLQKEEEQLDE